MKISLPLLAAAVAMTSLATAASAATQVVNGFGVNNWYSWDTRNTSGTQLFGTTDTNPSWSTWSPSNPGASSSADDTAIQSQIKFMTEGQVVNDAAGNTPPASPTGSLNGMGYVRLDGTSSNSGKSDLSYVNLAGIAPASALTDPTFSISYAFYSVAGTSPYISREPGLNIGVHGSDSVQYTFVLTPSYLDNVWNTENADTNTGVFTVHSANGENGATGTLAQLAADPTFGNDMFGAGAEINRLGFNIGSSQHAGLVYIDDVQTNLLNSGDVIDFQGVPEVPEPASLSLLGAGVVAVLVRRRKP